MVCREVRDPAGYVDIMVRAPIETTQVFVQQALSASGFRVKLVNPYKGTAEKASTAKKATAGEPAKTYKFDFEIIRFESNAVVRLHRAGPQCEGPNGVTDSRELNLIINALTTWFNQHGCLQGVLGL